MHRAPVVGILVLDGHGAPLPEPLEVAHDLARSPDMQGSHHLVVISEEQFKVRITHRNTHTHSHTQETLIITCYVLIGQSTPDMLTAVTLNHSLSLYRSGRFSEHGSCTISIAELQTVNDEHNQVINNLQTP